MLSGYKTYIVAAIMVVYAAAGYVLGKDAAIDWKTVLEAVGLAALRNGVSKS